jgi:hypothetical protein
MISSHNQGPGRMTNSETLATFTSPGADVEMDRTSRWTGAAKYHHGHRHHVKLQKDRTEAVLNFCQNYCAICKLLLLRCSYSVPSTLSAILLPSPPLPVKFPPPHPAAFPRRKSPNISQCNATPVCSVFPSLTPVFLEDCSLHLHLKAAQRWKANDPPQRPSRGSAELSRSGQ